MNAIEYQIVVFAFCFHVLFNFLDFFPFLLLERIYLQTIPFLIPIVDLKFSVQSHTIYRRFLEKYKK